MTRISVLIPDLDEWLSMPVAYCLKTSGRVAVHGLSRCKSRRLRLSNLFTSFDDLDDLDLGSWLARIDETVARQKIDIVMPVSSVAIRVLSEHRQALSCADRLVQLPAPDVFDIATNKASLASFLSAHGFPHPESVVIKADAPRPEKLSTLTFPVLLKPPVSFGGKGIKKFEGPSELDFFLARQGKEGEWLVQEWVEGSDIGVSVLCRNGQIIASTVQHAIVPSSIPFQAATSVEFRYDRAAMDVVTRLMKELNWSGVANIDMRLSRLTKAPLILEVNGRYWFSLLGSLHAHVNFPLLACESALGLAKTNTTPRETRYFGGYSRAALSLLGGGRWRVRPSETDLGYLVGDPIFFTSIALTEVAKFFRGNFLDRATSMATR